MKNQGISLITLIITIIVIIILAAIVIFTGLRTPDSAQFSAFTNDVDTVYTAIIDKFSDLKVEHAVKNDYRTNEQIYIELAIGADPGQYATMGTDKVNLGSVEILEEEDSVTLANRKNTMCQHILGYDKKSTTSDISHNVVYAPGGTAPTAATDPYVVYSGKLTTAFSANKNGLGDNFKLPAVRQYNDGWYVTKDGRVFNSTGFSYNKNVYYNASYYTVDANNEIKTTHNANRATNIADKMFNGSDFVVKSATTIDTL